MPDADPTILIILSEIVLIETTILLVIFLTFILIRRKRSKILSKVLTDAHNSQDQRRNNLHSLLKSNSLDESEQKIIVDEIVENEMEFHRYLSNLLHTGKTSAIVELTEMVQKLNKPFEKLANNKKLDKSTESKNETSSNLSAEAAIEELLEGDESLDSDGNVDPSLDLSNTSDVEDLPEELLNGENEIH